MIFLYIICEVSNSVMSMSFNMFDSKNNVCVSSRYPALLMTHIACFWRMIIGYCCNCYPKLLHYNLNKVRAQYSTWSDLWSRNCFTFFNTEMLFDTLTCLMWDFQLILSSIITPQNFISLILSIWAPSIRICTWEFYLP